jgi:hypothetical protein
VAPCCSLNGAGAFAGALHGPSWVPERWSSNLENSYGGRDEVLKLASQLSELRCEAVGQLPDGFMERELAALSSA